MTKQTRNRKPKARAGTLGTISLEQWRENADLLGWAQADARFHMLVTVLTNERINKLAHCNLYPGENVSEGQLLGIQRGYEACLEVLKKMQGAAEPPQKTQDDEPTYPRPNDFEQPDDVG